MDQNNQHSTHTNIKIDIKLVLLAISAITYLISFIGILTVNQEFTTQKVFNPIHIACMIGALVVFGLYYLIFKKDGKNTILIPVAHILICASAVIGIITLFSLQIEASVNYGRYMDMGQFFWSNIVPGLVNPVIYAVLFALISVFYFQGKFNKLLYLVAFGYIFAQAPTELTSAFSLMVINTPGAAFTFLGAIGEYLFLAVLFMFCYKNPTVYTPPQPKTDSAAVSTDVKENETEL